MARKRLELLKYMLIDTQGKVFEALLHYAGEHYSLASLLMELMQMNMHPQELGQANLSDDEEEKTSLADEKIAENKLLDELLTAQKKYVVEKLIDNLSLMHSDDEGLALST